MCYFHFFCSFFLGPPLVSSSASVRWLHFVTPTLLPEPPTGGPATPIVARVATGGRWWQSDATSTRHRIIWFRGGIQREYAILCAEVNKCLSTVRHVRHSDEIQWCSQFCSSTLHAKFHVVLGSAHPMTQNQNPSIESHHAKGSIASNHSKFGFDIWFNCLNRKAIGWILYRVDGQNEHPLWTTVAWKGALVENATSSFQCEVLALKSGLQFLAQVLHSKYIYIYIVRHYHALYFHCFLRSFFVRPWGCQI